MLHELDPWGRVLSKSHVKERLPCLRLADAAKVVRCPFGRQVQASQVGQPSDFDRALVLHPQPLDAYPVS